MLQNMAHFHAYRQILCLQSPFFAQTMNLCACKQRMPDMECAHAQAKILCFTCEVHVRLSRCRIFCLCMHRSFAYGKQYA